MHSHSGAVGQVDGHGGRGTGPDDDHARQREPPGGELDLRQRGIDLLLGARLDAQGSQNGDQRGPGGRGEIAVIVPVLGGDSVCFGELLQTLARRLGNGD